VSETTTVFEVECIAETEKAILVTDNAGFEEWIPKSQIHDDSEVYKEGTSGDLVVKTWMAKKLGLDTE